MKQLTPIIFGLVLCFSCTNIILGLECVLNEILAELINTTASNDTTSTGPRATDFLEVACDPFFEEKFTQTNQDSIERDLLMEVNITADELSDVRSGIFIGELVTYLSSMPLKETNNLAAALITNHIIAATTSAVSSDNTVDAASFEAAVATFVEDLFSKSRSLIFANMANIVNSQLIIDNLPVTIRGALLQEVGDSVQNGYLKTAFKERFASELFDDLDIPED